MRVLAVFAGLLAGLFGILGFVCKALLGIVGTVFGFSLIGLAFGWIAYQVPSAAEHAPVIWDLAFAGVKYGFFGFIILAVSWVVSWLLALLFAAVAASGASQ